MRIGILEARCFVRIEPIGEKGNFRVRFEDHYKRKQAPEEWKSTPWGYDGFRVFLPVEIIEKKLSSIFPGIAFSESDEEVTA